VEVQWNNRKKGVVDTTSDLLVKVERGARKLWIAREVLSKMDEGRTRKNVNNEEERKNNRNALSFGQSHDVTALSFFKLLFIYKHF
jgi:hypothetical protein